MRVMVAPGGDNFKSESLDFGAPGHYSVGMTNWEQGDRVEHMGGMQSRFGPELTGTGNFGTVERVVLDPRRRGRVLHLRVRWDRSGSLGTHTPSTLRKVERAALLADPAATDLSMPCCDLHDVGVWDDLTNQIIY